MHANYMASLAATDTLLAFSIVPWMFGPYHVDSYGCDQISYWPEPVFCGSCMSVCLFVCLYVCVCHTIGDSQWNINGTHSTI